MRANIVVVSLLTAGLLGSPTPAPAEPVGPASQQALPEEVASGVIVDLAGGDRFKVTVARNQRTVWGSRYDAATRSWGERTIVLRKNNVFCGAVDARAAGAAVAVIARCGKGTYYEDEAPTHSQALYSADTLTWHSTTLPGEADEEPGISPSGNAAIWPMHQQWVTWTSAGFSTVQHALPGQEYNVTATISDAGEASVLYGGRATSDEECLLHVLTLPVGAPEITQVLAVKNACQDEYRLTNVDALTVYSGYPASPSWLTTITRPDTASPWAVTGIPPEDAPGLVLHRGRGTTPTRFASSPGLPLQAVGSPDHRTFIAQSYDTVTQRWSAPRVIASRTRGCRWNNAFAGEDLGVFALRLTCGKRQRLLASTNAQVWYDVTLGRSPLGVSPDENYVSASTQKRTLIISRERGLVRLPVGTRARCDVIQPVSPDRAVRLSTTRKRTGWPSVLHESTATGWRRTDTKFPRQQVGSDRCVSVDVEFYGGPPSYWFRGRTHAVSIAVTAAGDDWKIRRGD